MTRTLVATPDPEPKPRYQVLPIATSPIYPGHHVTVTSGTWASNAHWPTFSVTATTTAPTR